jgi:predicted transcriptional regulator
MSGVTPAAPVETQVLVIDATGADTEVMSVDAARGVTERIRSAAVTAFDALAEVDGAVQAAYDGHAWVALGYESWEAYCAAEFSQTRMWATVEERHARTLALREGGMSVRASAAVLGVAKTTVQRDVAAMPPLSRVPDGTPDSGRSVGRDARSYPVVRASTAQVLERQVQVARLRSQGWSQTEVARELGVSQPTVSADESALSAATADLEAGARGRVEAVIQGGDVVDVEDLASAIGITLAPAATPGALLLEAARATVRDLVATAGYLRDGVVFSETWVSDRDAAAQSSAVLLTPLTAVVRDLAQALTRLDTGRVSERDLLRAREDVARAGQWLAAWGGQR